MNTFSPKKASPLPFSAHVCAFGGGCRIWKEGSAEKTQRPNASRFCYILRRIIIRRCKGWIPVWIPALTRSITALVSGMVYNQQVYRKQSCISFHITFKCNTVTAYSYQPVTFSSGELLENSASCNLQTQSLYQKETLYYSHQWIFYNIHGKGFALSSHVHCFFQGSL